MASRRSGQDRRGIGLSVFGTRRFGRCVMPRVSVTMERKVLSENDEIASELRGAFRDAETLSLNFIGSPGAGKTFFLERTLERLPAQGGIAVITGDLQTENDALRLRRYGHPVRQITTGGACHLDARMVQRHVHDWLMKDLRVLFIENVGNLVC